ncbi:AhpC/TSA antioxidant enzyme-domain-containing protein [Phellopilus nigrolimitatus]|nr:AhpC/TSA antioxidant enzyme-domain-containing protein [Phellopilus nigrolimitatus]
MASSQSIPNEETIAAAGQITVFDNKGSQVLFGDIFASVKTVVVFIRHFFCGMCQAYVSQLAAVSEKSLSEVGVKIVVIGCGEWQLIDNYKKDTGFTGDIYADPSRELYRKLNMTVETLAGTPAGEQKRSYVTGALSNVLKSIWRGPVSHPLHMGKQGNISQLGGDFIFGPGNTCQFAYLMKHTQDHVEVAELMEAAGVKST